MPDEAPTPRPLTHPTQESPVDVYKYAAQNALRFPSPKGQLTTEQLFQLPLKSQTGFDLDTVARAISVELKGMTEESFVENAANPLRQTLTVMLDVVKDVIATKQAENKAALDKAEKAAKRRKLQDILAAKEDEKLGQASIDEIRKQLAELDQ